MMINYSDEWEPVELRNLKKQLGNLNCQCKTCEKSRRHFLQRKPSVCDRAVQIEYEFQKNMYELKDMKQDEKEKRCSVGNCKWDSAICPSCFISMHLLRMGLPKTMKDVETEANMCGCKLKKQVVDNTTSFTFGDTVFPESSLCSKNCIIYSHKNPNKEVSFEIKQEKCVQLDELMNSIRPTKQFDTY